MSDYGYYSQKKKAKPRKSWAQFILRITDLLILCVTAVNSLALICALLAQYVSPEKSVFFAFAGLTFPILFVVQVIVTLYWVMRWRFYAFIAAAVLLMNIGNVRLFYRPDISEKYEEEKPARSELVAVSYNVMSFQYKGFAKRGETTKNISSLIKSNYADLWCVQEFCDDAAVRDTITKYLPDLKHSFYNSYVLSDGADRNHDNGLVIYSRYPIIKTGVITKADPYTARAIWADIRIKHDTVRVINCHLQSTYINDSDVDYLSTFHSVVDVQPGRLKDIVGKLSEKYKLRAPQAKAIAEFIALSPHHVIVCGDFNDTPASYCYRRISRRLRDSFAEQGSGISSTYNGFFNMFRIDYILMSRGLKVTNYYPFLNEQYSDHNPVTVSFEILNPAVERE